MVDNTYLDKSGLSYFWDKLKTYIATSISNHAAKKPTNTALGHIKSVKYHSKAATGITPGTDAVAVAVNNVTSTAGRYYAVETDSNGYGIVNIPWTDTDTKYTLSSFGVTATAAELNYCDGVTSNIQTQLNGKAATSHSHAISAITDLNSGWDALLKAAPSTYVTRWPSIGEVTSKQSFIIKVNTGTSEGTSLYTFNGVTAKTLDFKAGSNVTLTPTAGVLTISAKDTTYSTFKGATEDAAGAAGLVAKPEIEDATKFLKGDGTWAATPYPSVVGANGTTGLIKNGSSVTSASGYTPSPIIGGVPYYKDTNTTYSVATTSANGLMSAADKAKLDGIATGANKYVHPTTSGNKHIPTGGSAGQVLRWSADGTAVWGADNNTTYTQATDTKLGLIKIGYEETGKNYAVLLDDDGKAYVTVPWTDTDTKYTLSSFGVTATAAELNYCDGVTSNIQTQLNGKAATSHSHAISAITDLNSGWDALLKAAPSSYVTKWPTISEVTNKQNFTIKVNTGTTEGTSLYTFNGVTAKTLDIKAGSNVTLTPTAGVLTVSAKDTTYGAATTSTAGLMSAADKTKLDGIATGANKYVHPTTRGYKHIPAGGSAGQILRWYEDGAAAWGEDHDTTYEQATDTELGLIKIGYSASGKNYAVLLDDDGKAYVTVPWTDTKYTLSSFGVTATAAELNYCDGVTSNIQTQLNGKAASSHTHSAFKGATTSASGTAGFVPQPTTAAVSKFLKGDGTWTSVTSNLVTAMTGYAKQTAAAVSASDTLNKAIGKLEGKIDKIDAEKTTVQGTVLVIAH